MIIYYNVIIIVYIYCKYLDVTYTHSIFKLRTHHNTDKYANDYHISHMYISLYI